MTGAVLGGAAGVFSEITQSLGCLLGGFCFSMWILVLKPGGSIGSTTGKAVFITIFTIAAFGTSFSRHTKDYALILSISFSGATAVSWSMLLSKVDTNTIMIDCAGYRLLFTSWAQGILGLPLAC